MNNKLFKIGRSLVLLAIAGLALTSCEKDDASNPTFVPGVESFQLNVPANATNNTYDLSAAESINLTCVQPNYGGVPYVVRYFVQMSLDKTFGTNADAIYRQLDTYYTTASMNVDAVEINNAIIDMFREANGDVPYPEESRPVYVRLMATPVTVANVPLDTVFSNVIELPKVLATFIPPTLTYPSSLYLVGSSIGDGADKGYWSYWKMMAPVFGNEPATQGDFYSIIYVPDGGMFKWGESEGDWRGYDKVAEFDDQAGAGVHEAANDGNIQFDKGGWYLVYVTSKLGASAVAYTFHIYPAHAYIIGAAAGGAWNDGDANWELTAPADGKGQWVSPAFAGSGELRAYIKVPGLDWWKTEYTLYKGTLYWRTVNIPDNWASNVGAEYSVNCETGQRLYVDFNISTGEVK